MDTFIETIYLNEILNQCEYAVTAVHRMNEILRSQELPSEFFRLVGYFLQHCSAVSRLLWPPGDRNKQKKKRAKQRGAYLRTCLRISDTHGLHNRTIRDHLEHFDDRLDDWVEHSPHRNIVDYMIGPRSAIGGDAINDKDIMRMYDPDKKIFFFRGERFDVQAIVDGVMDVQSKAKIRVQEIEQDRYFRQPH